MKPVIIRQCAKRATHKVKSIKEWIKMGGKNNRAAVLERLDKRDRDSFRHLAHKKPQKKMEGKDSTVYATMSQTLFE